MKLITILFSVLFTLSAFSKVEIHCELYDSGQASTRKKSINQRIKQLEDAGYNVNITNLTSAIGGANDTYSADDGQTRKQLKGRIRHEKCASLTYRIKRAQ